MCGGSVRSKRLSASFTAIVCSTGISASSDGSSGTETAAGGGTHRLRQNILPSAPTDRRARPVDSRAVQPSPPWRRPEVRAIVVTENGGPEVLELRDLDDPQPGAG